ncbi:hypothetical protein J6590_062398 [Homalodisca vitripennis]|nr:hypothetical protein J6590_062398 [Homalodisca vitripennis]
MKELSMELTHPHMQTRLQNASLQRNLRAMICDNLNLRIPPTANRQPTAGARKICSFCPSAKRRMTTSYWSCCHSAMCGEHRAMCCVRCDES